jgi:hypothetical protein
MDEPGDRAFSFGPNPRHVPRILSQSIHFAVSTFEGHEEIFERKLVKDSEIVRLWHEAMEIPLQ